MSDDPELENTDPELGVSVQTPMVQDIIIPTDSWYYMATHRQINENRWWSGSIQESVNDALQDLKFYKDNETYETKILRFKLPI